MLDVQAIKNVCRLDKISGVVTWLVVAGMSLLVMVNNSMPAAAIAQAVALYIAYLILWLFLVSETVYEHDATIRLSVLGILFCIVIAIYFTVPMSFNSILMGIIGGALPYYFTIKRSLIIGTVASFPLLFVYQFYWGQSFVFLSAALFWTFNMFAIIMVNATVNERLAKEQAEASNRELISTQALLKEASKQSERVRIARNIHDLLGHHLTALTINLQVASLKTDGEVKQNIDQCHQLAKLLLSDVREAVSDIRDKGHVDLRSAIEAMTKQVSSVNIDVNFSETLSIDDIEIADTIMKCIQESITNTIKHGRGRQIDISVLQQQQSIKLHIQSDGKMPKQLILGNGLKGMSERIELLKGKINFVLGPEHFTIDAFIPLNNEQIA